MEVSPRSSMTVLPGWLQPFLTWVTGMPLADERPHLLTSPWRHAAAASCFLVVGLTAGAAAFASSLLTGALIMPVALLLVTSGMRYHYAVIEHYCIHNSFARSRWANRVIAELISTALFAAPYDVYRRDHLKHHYTTRTDDDPDVIFLVSMGFRRGMSRSEFRSYMARTLIAPSYHLRYLAARAHTNLLAPPYRVIMTIVYAVGTVWVLRLTGLWMPWLVLWVLPATLLFQASSLINYHSEHPWLLRTDLKGRAAMAAVNVGRFCGDPVPYLPDAGRSVRALAWSRWWLKLLLVHLPYRLFVLVGDQSQHDLHHRRPGSDWSIAPYCRRDDAACGTPGWPVGYQDVWGTVLDHLDACIEEPGHAEPASGHHLAFVAR